ncbi:zinc ABC transporter substrate-binding protein ZnuA [Pasteurellaceae bacterium LIM206]|nr:zinc ABC transporter substrate-binding protein ZnuA [Pasteurellaceae bacterium LIM206]
MTKKFLQITLLASAIAAVTGTANANIVTSIKPLGFIASSIADGVTDTEVIVPAGASPHDYSLKPSDVQQLKSTGLLLWIGEDVDGFLAKSIKSIDGKKVINISELEAIKPLLSKAAHHHHDGDEGENEHHHDHDKGSHQHEEHAHSGHQHEHEAHDHDHDHDGLSTNWHVWYSPAISQVVAQQVADKLTAQFPAQKERIAQNLAEFNHALTAQGEKIQAQLVPFKDKGFYVFHDAYGYFNDTYGLQQTGYFTINPLVAPGAKTLAIIKEEIAEHKVSCLFAEPQFTPKVIESLSKGTGVHVGHLDPMGEKVALGKDSYAKFLQLTADSYAECLSK